jgi:hypothetical protein
MIKPDVEVCDMCGELSGMSKTEKPRPSSDPPFAVVEGWEKQGLCDLWEVLGTQGRRRREPVASGRADDGDRTH